MDIDPDEIVTVELAWDNDGLEATYNRAITRHQLGNLLMQIDDMADKAEAAQEGAA